MERDLIARAQPLRPQDCVEAKIEHMPDEVLTVFNGLIAERALHGRALVYQDEVVAKLEEAGVSSRDIYGKHWLDVEDIYREAGWKVEYDKPGYNETYRAFFVFEADK